MNEESPASPLEGIPQILTPPVDIVDDQKELVIWEGQTTFGEKGATRDGVGKVYLDLQHPIGFEFVFDPSEKRSLQDSFVAFADDANSDFAPGQKMSCDGPIGEIECEVFGVGENIHGSVREQTELDRKRKSFHSARVLIFNGPKARGSVVRVGQGAKSGRWSIEQPGMSVTVDEHRIEQDPKRGASYNTHVAELQYDDKVSVARIEHDLSTLHQTLSLMNCRWVGIVGPWLEPAVGDGTKIFRLGCWKGNPFGHSGKWYSAVTPNIFEELFPAMRKTNDETDRSTAVRTALHWAIESDLCSGGIEGSLILQQAALECLAWSEIYSERGICSYDGFKSLKAVDKIRWLLSIYRIRSSIPSHCAALLSFANDTKSNDLIDALVSARNVLVHAEPRTSSELFNREGGDAERAELWYQIGGLLHQAILAVIGFSGEIVMRDHGPGYEVQAIEQTPWSVENQVASPSTD